MNANPDRIGEQLERAGIPPSVEFVPNYLEGLPDNPRRPFALLDPETGVLDIPLPALPTPQGADQKLTKNSNEIKAQNPSTWGLPEGVERQTTSAGLPKRDKRHDVFDKDRLNPAPEAPEPKAEEKVVAIGRATVPTSIALPEEARTTVKDSTYQSNALQANQKTDRQVGRHRVGVALGSSAQQNKIIV